ncbi:MAG: SIS domain-containing protein [Bdellovibrionaceae bacterium]|nr:SIS domain-containing protein [Pseudobdellovibrionaceae bacterium]
MSDTTHRSHALHLKISQLPPAARERARTFLETAHEFHLGGLPTEQAHPKTRELSRLAKSDVLAALELFRDVELEAYTKIRSHMPAIEHLIEDIRATLRDGGRIFLSGCGATGRLSLSLETLWRRRHTASDPRRDAIVSFMAGGDFALVRSIENFEDHPEYGERQLQELGYRKGDLLLAITEGGETPFVIGSAEAAASRDGRAPWFLYCNPDEILERTADRSRRVLQNERIQKLNLTVGPMAITGSTRLQATSVLMFAAGSALFHAAGLGEKPELELDRLMQLCRSADLRPLIPHIEAEAATYAAGEACLHTSDEHAITVFTDVTERSPTFSLPAFENSLFATPGPQRPAWTYMEIPGTHTASEAWEAILARPPRALDWEGIAEKFGSRSLLGFDFSEGVESRRRSKLGGQRQHRFDIRGEGHELRLTFQGHTARFTRGTSLLSEHLLLKLLLNASSTIVMGRLYRFEGNVMLWVKSSNNKLIDRSVRYVQGLLDNAGLPVPPYNEIVLELFNVLETLGPDEPAVMKTRDRLLNAMKSK